MKKENDFSVHRFGNSLYEKKLKQKINISIETIAYFKELSQSTGIPYQNLIAIYLEDCAHNHREPKIMKD